MCPRTLVAGVPSYRTAIRWICLLLILNIAVSGVWGQVSNPSSPGQILRSTQTSTAPYSPDARTVVPHSSTSVGVATNYVGSQSCRPCHAAIFDRYMRTNMAQTSGPAFRGLVPGAFTHAASSVAYRVTDAEGLVYLEYHRTDGAGAHGIEQLQYYLGSGKHGRAYLFSNGGYLFQSPVNYYADPGHWDMSPGYQNVREMPLNHAVERSCLFCHTSQVAAPGPGTVNRYPSPPFAEHGVSCERCHGPGSAHVSRKARMFVPLSSDAAARDAICAQCHLEGDATVAAPGKDLFDFRPGHHLEDFLSVFLVRSSNRQNLHPASHFEALAASQCKLKSGDRMSCLSCHDPHDQPPPQTSSQVLPAHTDDHHSLSFRGAQRRGTPTLSTATGASFQSGEGANPERATYYRAKCLACHTAPRYAREHHAQQPDCTVCHMPRLRSTDAAHAMLTDHRIPREPLATESAAGQASPLNTAGSKTVEVFLGPKTSRSLGLAYAQLAETDASFSARALSTLEQALKDGSRDPDVLTHLAFLQQESGNTARAEQLYREALAADPLNRVANANLGVIYAKSARVTDAVQLWSRIFDLNPFLSEVGANLAVISCQLGNEPAARQRLTQVLHFNPDYRRAEQLLSAMQAHTIVCARQ